MRITPLDIYKREFKRVFRGIDPDEIEAFLEQIADDYEEIIKENAQLKQRMQAFESGEDGELYDQESVDAIIQDAEEKAGKILEYAKSEADKIREEARQEADKIIQKAEEEASPSQTEKDARKIAEELIRKAQEDSMKIIENAEKDAEAIVAKAKEENSKLEESSGIIQKAKEEASMIIQKAKDDAKQSENVNINKILADMLDESKLKANEAIEKVKMSEIDAKRGVSRLKIQNERYLAGYKDLFDKQMKNMTNTPKSKTGGK